MSKKWFPGGFRHLNGRLSSRLIFSESDAQCERKSRTLNTFFGENLAHNELSLVRGSAIYRAHVDQLDFLNKTKKNNLPTIRGTSEGSETSKLGYSTRRIQSCPDYFCLGIILKVIQYNFKNDA